MANALTAWIGRLTGRSDEARNRRRDDEAEGPIGTFVSRLKGARAAAGGSVGYTWQPPGQGGRADRRRPPAPFAPRPVEATNPAGGQIRTGEAGGAEWSVPRDVGASADIPADRRGPAQPGAGSAFDRSSIPAPIARVTERLGRVVDRGSGWGGGFTRIIDRLTGMGASAPPPSKEAQAATAARGLSWKGAPVGSEWTEAELIQDVKEASKRETSRLARTLLRFMLGFFAVFLVWAAIFRIDEVTRGEGKVIASSQTQVIANLEGGIVNAVLVREGDVVEKGQPLMRLSNMQAVAQFADNRAKYLSLLAQVARLTAEINGTPVNFPPEVAAEAPEVVRAEAALMTARLTQFETQMQILRDQRAQRAQELADLRNKATKLEQQLKLAQEQLAILEPLAAEGLAPRVDVIRSQRDRTQSETDLESAKLQIPRAEAAMREAERKIEEKLQTFKAEAQKELNERRTQLEGVSEMQRADRDRVRRTEIVSPMRGTVKQIMVKTMGGVVKPGQELVEVVPLEDTLLVEVKISPADVGFVHEGQKASVKVTAYDYSIYGALDAKVENVSADSIVDPQDREQKPYFRVRLRTQKSAFGTAAKPLAIQPGMTVTADILTGDRTVLTYLLKPFFKTVSSALGER